MIDDFRAKLLALLPLSSGAGIFLLLQTDTDREHLDAIGVVGFLVSLGLFIYEQGQSAICRQLIDAGTMLEQQLGLPRGQFINRRTLLTRRPMRARGEGGVLRQWLRRVLSPVLGPVGRKTLDVLAFLGIRSWINVASWVVYLTVLGGWAYMAYIGFQADSTAVGAR